MVTPTPQAHTCLWPLYLQFFLSGTFSSQISTWLPSSLLLGLCSSVTSFESPSMLIGPKEHIHAMTICLFICHFLFTALLTWCIMGCPYLFIYCYLLPLEQKFYFTLTFYSWKQWLSSVTTLQSIIITFYEHHICWSIYSVSPCTQ